MPLLSFVIEHWGVLLTFLLAFIAVVNEMADAYGMAALINSGRFRPEPVDLRPHFELHEGSHAKAFFVLCEWPEIFHAALRYRRVDAIAEHRWVKTGRIEGTDLDISEDAQRRMAEVISRHYRELGRGQGCAVDVELRDDEVYTQSSIGSRLCIRGHEFGNKLA